MIWSGLRLHIWWVDLEVDRGIRRLFLIRYTERNSRSDSSLSTSCTHFCVCVRSSVGTSKHSSFDAPRLSQVSPSYVLVVNLACFVCGETVMACFEIEGCIRNSPYVVKTDGLLHVLMLENIGVFYCGLRNCPCYLSFPPSSWSASSNDESVVLIDSHFCGNLHPHGSALLWKDLYNGKCVRTSMCLLKSRDHLFNCI